MPDDTTFKVIQPSGVLTAGTSQFLVQQIDECLEAQTRLVLIDLQGVDFIDSSGLGTLVAVYTKLKLANSKLYFCAPKEQASLLFNIAGVDCIFEIFPSRHQFELTVRP